MRSRQIMAIRINCCSISKLHVYTYIFISLLWQWALPQTWSITVKSNEFFVHTNARYFPHLMLFFFPSSNIDCNRTSCDLVITAHGHNWFFCKWFIWFGVCNWVFMLITISDDVKLLKSNEFTDLKNEKKRIFASRGNWKKKRFQTPAIEVRDMIFGLWFQNVWFQSICVRWQNIFIIWRQRRGVDHFRLDGRRILVPSLYRFVHLPIKNLDR